MKRSRSALVALGLVVVTGLGSGVLGGCSGGDPEPRIAPSSPISASASKPPAASGGRGPVDTVTAWVAARNEALNGRGVAAVERLSSADCKTCDGLIRPIEQVYDSGGSFRTDGWRVIKAKAKVQNASRVRVDAGVVMSAGTTLPSQGASPNRYGAERHIVVFKLTRVGDSWLVSFLGFLS